MRDGDYGATGARPGAVEFVLGGTDVAGGFSAAETDSRRGGCAGAVGLVEFFS